jgi:hypothetical protein
MKQFSMHYLPIDMGNILVAAAASESEASEQGSRPNLYVYVLYICS